MSDGFEFPVDRTAIMLFASALGETNRIYYDEAYAEKTPLAGVIAPPTFPIASAHWNPTYGLRGVRQIPAAPAAAPVETRPSASPNADAGADAAAAEAGGEGAEKVRGGGLSRLLHGEQRFSWHRPMRPGMKLRVTWHPGKRWTRQGRRGGEMHFQETIAEYRDADGELVVTATSVAIETSVAVEA